MLVQYPLDARRHPTSKRDSLQHLMGTADPAVFRRTVYSVLIVVAVASACGRILSAQRVYEPSLNRDDPRLAIGSVLLPFGADGPLGAAALTTAGHESWGKIEPRDIRFVWPRTRPNPMPTFSSNDRSRWATVHSLVDQGTYVVGRRMLQPDNPNKPYRDEGIVFQDGWGTVDVVKNPDTDEFYSSKPPFLATQVAGEYWVLQKLFGWKINESPFLVIRVILLTINVLPMLLYWLLLARLVERFGKTDWARFFVLAAACFGTLLTPFLITFNNHTIAACTALFALHTFLLIWEGSDVPGWYFAIAGFCAAYTACSELPAALFGVMLFLLLMSRNARRTLAWFVPAAVIPVAFFLATNYLAIGRLRPAYSEFGGPWYEYEGSHWLRIPGKEMRGIDWAGDKETKATYAFHLLLGHHGLFSLYPILLFAVVGMVAGAFALARERRRLGWKRKPEQVVQQVPALPLVAAMTLSLTVVVVGFYILKSDNYGGWSSGPRWLLWLTPLWLLTMLPILDRLSQWRWGRWLACALLALSVLSASYPAWNAWRMPWLYNLMEAEGWIEY